MAGVRELRLKDMWEENADVMLSTFELKRSGNLRNCSPTGGATTVTIMDAEGSILALGVAVCRAEEPFTKRIGRAVAYGRAVQQLGENKPSLKTELRAVE